MLLASGLIGGVAAKNSEAARVVAPELPSVDAWLSTDQPLTLKSLRGQVVLLDFWTYCCINCLHVLPDLAWLEDKYRDQPFVVIGVHSGKFSQEKDPIHIRQAIERHNIRHPVAVDSDYEVWHAYAVRAWPTMRRAISWWPSISATVKSRSSASSRPTRSGRCSPRCARTRRRRPR